MYSTIYQLSRCPIDAQDYCCKEKICAGEMVTISSISDSVEEYYKDEIKRLVEFVLPKGMFTINSDSSLTYNGGFAQWKKEYLKLLRLKMKAININNVMEYVGPAYQLQKAIANPLDTDVLFVIDFYNGVGIAERSGELMHLIQKMKKGDRLYPGTILSYHP